MPLYITMEFIQAFYPQYTFPIITVVLFILIVYALGFKSPIQPPSFDGLDGDKKYSKKRKTKEAQKQSKSVSNGKVNGIAVNKGKIAETSKKRETSDTAGLDKLDGFEKIFGEKRAVKKSISQREKKLIQEKKKENLTTEELNEDGWVQLVSKKGRKNRKRDDVLPSVQSIPQESVGNFALETGVKESPKHAVSDVIPSESSSLDKKTKPIDEKPKKKSSKNEISLKSNPDSSESLAAPVEVKSVDFSNGNLNEAHLDIPAAVDDSSKSRKKKKKHAVVAPSDVAMTEIVSPATPLNSKSIEIIPIPQTLESSMNSPIDTIIDSKSNVVFDELAGLYPETKEKEKKKKKVRRDH